MTSCCSNMAPLYNRQVYNSCNTNNAEHSAYYNQSEMKQDLRESVSYVTSSTEHWVARYSIAEFLSIGPIEHKSSFHIINIHEKVLMNQVHVHLIGKSNLERLCIRGKNLKIRLAACIKKCASCKKIVRDRSYRTNFSTPTQEYEYTIRISGIPVYQIFYVIYEDIVAAQWTQNIFGTVSSS